MTCCKEITMRVSLLCLSLCCLVEWVSSNALPSAGNVLRSEHDGNDSIIGGSPAAVGEFPYLSGFLFNNNLLCGGSLIAPNIILTAAHCLAGKSQSIVKSFKVVLNSTSLNGGTGAVVKTVRKFVVHPKYSSRTQDNDVALLALSSPATGVKTISLPPAGSTVTYAGKAAVIAGYGTTYSGGSISTKLLKANAVILDNTVCNKQYGGINALEVCAAAKERDSCEGDSGGSPLVVNGILVGVTSYGIGCSDPKHAGVYARVSAFVSWIKTTSATI